MLTFASKYGYNVFSQFGEDGILEEVCYRLKLHMPRCCEFGANDGIFCSNTFLIIKSCADESMMIEADKTLFNKLEQNMKPYNVDCINEMVTVDNINKWLDFAVPDILSMDTDGPDYELWQVYKGTPAIVIIEINSSLPPMVEHYAKENGASYISMLKLGISKGYFLLCHTGNMIFVRNEYRELFPEIVGDGVNNWQEYFNTSWQ